MDYDMARTLQVSKYASTKPVAFKDTTKSSSASEYVHLVNDQSPECDVDADPLPMMIGMLICCQMISNIKMIRNLITTAILTLMSANLYHILNSVMHLPRILVRFISFGRYIIKYISSSTYNIDLYCIFCITYPFYIFSF
jgi:hypothetical protein